MSLLSWARLATPTVPGKARIATHETILRGSPKTLLQQPTTTYSDQATTGLKIEVSVVGLPNVGDDPPRGALETPPTEDSGAETQDRYGWQHHCTAADCLEMLSDPTITRVVCEARAVLAEACSRHLGVEGFQSMEMTNTIDSGIRTGRRSATSASPRPLGVKNNQRFT